MRRDLPFTYGSLPVFVGRLSEAAIVFILGAFGNAPYNFFSLPIAAKPGWGGSGRGWRMAF